MGVRRTLKKREGPGLCSHRWILVTETTAYLFYSGGDIKYTGWTKGRVTVVYMENNTIVNTTRINSVFRGLTTVNLLLPTVYSV